jgi:hypothetical protein
MKGIGTELAASILISFTIRIQAHIIIIFNEAMMTDLTVVIAIFLAVQIDTKPIDIKHQIIDTLQASPIICPLLTFVDLLPTLAEDQDVTFIAESTDS